MNVISEPTKQQLGEGGDDYAAAAQKTAQAAREFSNAARQAAHTAEASSAASAAVSGAAQTGSAVAKAAVGTATGGPAGALIAAAWSLKRTLFKVIVCVCLLILFFIVAIVSLPSIVFNQVFQTDPASLETDGYSDIYEIYDEMAHAVNDSVTRGYDMALAQVEAIIADGGYDYDASMNALIDRGRTSADYDAAYVLAAYSVSMEQRGTTKADMAGKLDAVAGEMFRVTFEEKEIVRESQIVVIEEDGSETSQTEREVTKYAQCTIHPFDQSVFLRAFGIDPNGAYNKFGITNAEAIRNMADALKTTLYGSSGSGEMPMLTDAESSAFLNRLDGSAARKELVRTALSLVGRVPYFWGGKSSAGWNERWNTPRLVTSSGSGTSGTIRPYGLDCSGFTDWAYKTAFGKGLPAGSSGQWRGSTPVTKRYVGALPQTPLKEHIVP